jgi:hypothetical protein
MVNGKLEIKIRVLSVVLLVVLVACLGIVSSASAMRPWWQLSASTWPAVLPVQGEGAIVVVADNLGDAEATGSEVFLKDKLPAGMTVQEVSFQSYAIGSGKEELNQYFCENTPSEVTCKFPAQALALSPYETLELKITVKIEGSGANPVNEASISGGEAAPVSLKRPLSIGGSPTGFGVEDYALVPEAEGGGLDTQAGSHPFQLSTTLTLNQTADPAKPPALAKDLRFELPAGLIGNPTPFPQCSQLDFATQGPELIDFCPNDTAVGVAVITFDESRTTGVITVPVPLFNLKPAVGEPARFGFSIYRTLNVLDTSVRTGGGYNVVVEDKNITQAPNFIAARVTFWGVPGDPVHDSARGWSCIAKESQIGNIESGVIPPCKPLSQQTPPPLLTMPTSCIGPLHTTVQGDSWAEAGAFLAPFEAAGEPSLDGCNRLPFGPSIKVTPDGTAGSTPTGLTVDEHVPQDSTLLGNGLAESAVKGLSVTLPAGVVLNPAAADGLQACQQSQIGLQDAGVPGCPDASKVATVRITTPLLPDALEGAAYLATQDTNPFKSLVALYVFAEDPTAGVRVKATGEVLEDPVTGQLTAHFEHDPLFEGSPIESQFLPELPAEDIELHFFGGDRAPLSTPATCGSYTTTGTFTPWAENGVAESSSTFNITTGPNAGPCNNPLPFNPSLAAGTTSIQAGGFSPFTMTMSRADGNQNLKAIQLRMPPGLLGTLATVKLCDEARANAGTCGPESLIGHTTVGVGVGGDPYTVTGGEVFITEGYKGAPYGLSIVNPAKAGPFDLGKVVVRAKIEVDPITAVLTITSDDSGPYKIPTILDGIPLQIQHVNVSIDRPGFTFNPTNCSPLAITGSLSSDQGAVKDLSVPFQITNCAVLAFKPKLTAKTSGKTSRAKGASLSVKLTYPAGPFDANIAKVKVDLPKQLPSRLTTLQKACPAAMFNANPASCPSASIVGHATATTPVMPVSLTGPAYFVSHGGEAFPDLVIVLQGYGATVHLVGTTFINKAGITSSTFKQIPDVPVGTFELTLPQGKYSALAANGNLCTITKLAMPTSFIAQNGVSVHTNTPITPTGCARHKTAKKAKHKRRKKK